MTGKQEEITDWMSEDGLWPSHHLTDHNWNKLLSNTPVYLTATMWDCEYNFWQWAYGGYIEYSDVKETFKVLGVDPNKFKELEHGYSHSGENYFRGYFPPTPKRTPKVKIEEMRPQALYSGVLNFCLGSLADVAAVASEDSKKIRFKKGTSIVVHDFGNGAGICEAELIDDVVVKREDVEFANDRSRMYGIQSCYGFVSSFWDQGGVESA